MGRLFQFLGLITSRKIVALHHPWKLFGIVLQFAIIGMLWMCYITICHSITMCHCNCHSYYNFSISPPMAVNMPTLSSI